MSRRYWLFSIFKQTIARCAILSASKFLFVGEAFSLDRLGWKAAPTEKDLTYLKGRLRMIDIYTELHRALTAGERCVLARIIRQAGSAPRPVGTRFLVKADGTHLGSIGGGLLEHEVLRKAEEVIDRGRPAVLEVRMSGKEVAAGEMLCGGNVDVLLEPVFPEDERARSVFQEIALMTAQGRRGTLVTAVREDRSDVRRVVVTAEGRVIGDASGLSTLPGVDLKRWASVREFSLEIFPQGTVQVVLFVEPVAPEAVLLLFGAGHISTFVAPLARSVGFRVCVIDDREEFANPERFPTADQLLVCPVAEAFDRVAVTSATYIAIVTRGHVHDRDALQAALATRPAYLGMIGSRRKRDLIYAALKKEGVSAEDLGRVHCPIGISIGAETPEEIAVSIVAELIQVRARGWVRAGTAGPSLQKATPETRAERGS
jgi:xanthine dehydrogenase accessory factor